MFIVSDVTCTRTCFYTCDHTTFIRQGKTISIFHGCMMWIGKSVTRVTDRHNEACRVMPNSDPE